MANIQEVSVEMNFFDILKVGGKWNPTKEERLAAWELYIELVTRASVFPLGKDEGSDREALTSLYKLFQTTRDILRKYGPGMAVLKKKEASSVAHISIAMLNYGLRPFLSSWHTELTQYEYTRDASKSLVEHERAWPRHSDFREALQKLQPLMDEYAKCLATIAGIPQIFSEQQSKALKTTGRI